MGYSLCMMADFQNALISRIFGVFWSGFLHRTTVNDLGSDEGVTLETSGL